AGLPGAANPMQTRLNRARTSCMRLSDPKSQTGDAARARLLSDQVLRPIAEQRARLSIVASRLDRAGRGAIMQSLASRVKTDRRFAPLFRQLIQMALEG